MCIRGMVIAGVAALTAACDDYGSGPDEQGLLTGTWTGTAEIVGVETVEVTFALTDYLGVVTGTLATAAGTSGSITGTVSGSTLTFDLAITEPCAGAFDGFAEIEEAGSRLSGGYFGGSPCTGPVNVFFVVDRP